VYGTVPSGGHRGKHLYVARAFDSGLDAERTFVVALGMAEHAFRCHTL